MFDNSRMSKLFERLPSAGWREVAQSCAKEAVAYALQHFPDTKYRSLLQIPENDGVDRFRSSVQLQKKKWQAVDYESRIPQDVEVMAATDVILMSLDARDRLSAVHSIYALKALYQKARSLNGEAENERHREETFFIPAISKAIDHHGYRQEHYEGETYLTGDKRACVTYKSSEIDLPWVVYIDQRRDRSFATPYLAAAYLRDDHEKWLQITWERSFVSPPDLIAASEYEPSVSRERP